MRTYIYSVLYSTVHTYCVIVSVIRWISWNKPWCAVVYALWTGERVALTHSIYLILDMKKKLVHCRIVRMLEVFWGAAGLNIYNSRAHRVNLFHWHILIYCTIHLSPQQPPDRNSASEYPESDTDNFKTLLWPVVLLPIQPPVLPGGRGHSYVTQNRPYKKLRKFV